MYGVHDPAKYMGTTKDGSPVYAVDAVDTTLYGASTLVIAASGVALGWLVMSAVTDFFLTNKK